MTESKALTSLYFIIGYALKQFDDCQPRYFLHKA